MPEWAFDCNSEGRLKCLEELFEKSAKRPRSIDEIPGLLKAAKENRRRFDATHNEWNYLALFVLEGPLVDRFRQFGVYPGRIPDQLINYCLQRIVEERWSFEHQYSADQLRRRTVYVYFPDDQPSGSVVQAAKRIVPFRYRIVDGREASILEQTILRSAGSPADVLIKVIECLRFGDYYWIKVTGTVDMGIAILVEFDPKGKSGDVQRNFSVLFGDRD